MLYLASHFIWFFLPGLLFLYLIGCRRSLFLLSLSISYAFTILPLLVLVHLRSNPIWFSRVQYSSLGILLIASLLRAALQRDRTLLNLRTLSQRFARRLPSLGIILILVISFCIYWSYAGPYSEVPGDFLSHLNGMQRVIARTTAEGRFWTDSSLPASTMRQDCHWYFIAAWLCSISGTSVEAAYGIIMLANSLTFLLGILYFGLLVFRRLRCSCTTKTWMAASAAFFSFSHLGVMVFSYVRYYALAPTMLNHVVLLATLAVCIDALEGSWSNVRLFLFTPVLMLVMLTVHTQEAVFAAVMIPLLSLTTAASSWMERRRLLSPAFMKSMLLFCLSMTAWILAFVWLRYTKEPSSAHLHLLNRLSDYVPILQRGMILNPFSAVEVITFWGLFVYLLFITRIKVFVRTPLIMGGMLVPFVTFFNPLFVDMMLRYHLSGASVIYRFGYIVPLQFVAGKASVDAIAGLVRGSEAAPAWKTLINRFWHAVVLLGLILLIFPLSPGMLRQSRLPTILKVHRDNSPVLWGDLCAFLRSLPSKHIIADPVTSYVVGGMTRHAVGIDRFQTSYWQLSVDSPETPMAVAFRHIDPDYKWLLIINRRDGATSTVGAYSLHWPADVLKVSAYYPDLVVEYMESRPDVFIKIWEEDSISVYDINLEKALDG